MVIEFRYKNVGGCQDNACYGYIRIMQDGLIALSGFQGNAGWVYNVYVDITDEIGTPYTGPLARLTKGHVTFCHHLATVICRPSSVSLSHLILLI
jgi:hypothetical protein